VSGDEAGRDGLWRQRVLVSQGLANRGGDAARLEVTRRRRRAKTDRLAVHQLRSLLLRP
jgi:transposase